MKQFIYLAQDGFAIGGIRKRSNIQDTIFVDNAAYANQDKLDI